jgi:ATP-binding cassette subfamily B protein
MVDGCRYARSIRSNICFGLEPEDGVPPEEAPTMGDIEAAARLANAHEFIMAMPNGYETVCSYFLQVKADP